MNLRTETGKLSFYQWDTDQILFVEDAPDCQQVHFCHRADANALVCSIREADGKRIADVPNILLQQDKPITAYLFHCDDEGNQTRQAWSFQVLSRPKPAGYVYTQTEVQTYEVLEKRVAGLEANTGTGSAAVRSVNEVKPDKNGNITIAIPDAVTDDHINSLIDVKLGVIENGTY